MLEKLLRHTGRMLAEHQVAYLFKVPEEFRATPCDFFGYTAKGRAILIEAKEVNRPSLPIGKDPGLKPHQWNALMDAYRAECISLICWYRQDIDQVATLPMDMAANLSRDRKSIPWKDISQFVITENPKMSDWGVLLWPYLVKPALARSQT